jgi:hypothetical protein
VVDLYRKILLTAMIIFVDGDFGSSKVCGSSLRAGVARRSPCSRAYHSSSRGLWPNLFLPLRPKVFRLVSAAFISASYLALLALARPFRLQDDLYLACAGSLLLTCCFVSGIVVQICNDDDSQACDKYIGLNLNWCGPPFRALTSLVGLGQQLPVSGQAATRAKSFLNQALHKTAFATYIESSATKKF